MSDDSTRYRLILGMGKAGEGVCSRRVDMNGRVGGMDGVGWVWGFLPRVGDRSLGGEREVVCRGSPRGIRIGGRAVRTWKATEDDRSGVENGVELPSIRDTATLDREKRWLAQSITQWLDDEWMQQRIHEEIGQRVADIYARQVLEGETDLGGMVLAAGTELESMDMRDAFVGPFDIANKMSELILLRMGREVCCADVENDGITTPDETPDIASSGEQGVGGHSRPPGLPSLATGFDKYRFMGRLMDGSISAMVGNAAVLITLGYNYNGTSMSWEAGSDVEPFWTDHFPEQPPKFLGPDADDIACGEIDRLFLSQSEDVQSGLDDLIEALYGEEATRMAREESDPEFRQRERVCKFLHFVGDY
uniref:Uncharacterized protein n=1 Tax=Compsopogon caeruleus TaxID=31354 RepID=A0A6T6BSA5_9RHOD|mmetsp:Transcript_18089/g.37578  ORF Transcript_18089/g.37578 Transcript_18089/m.37578 type:complete len:363 (+) Transcript_18089:2534-3622(+)